MKTPGKRAAVGTLVALMMSASGVSRAAEEWVRFSPDGRQILVETPGISAFRGGATVVFDAEGKTQRFGTAGLTMIQPVRTTVGTTPYGAADISTVTFASKDSPCHFTLILKRLKLVNAFTLQAVFHNRSDGDVHLRSFDLLNTDKNGGGSFTVANPAEWLVTPLMEASPALPLSAMKATLQDAALICQPNGNGLLIGPVGPAEAYTAVSVRDQSLNASVNMEGVLVRAGESRRSEEVLFCFEPSTSATEIWTRWVAVTHKARLNKERVYGWCSWYDRTTNVDEASVLEVADVIKVNPNVFGKGVLQIDDGYQKADGDWRGNAKFPSGMDGVARKIREIGWVPGVWFAPLMIDPKHPWPGENPGVLQSNGQGIESFMNPNPFHPGGAKWIRPDHPKSREFLAQIIKDARDRSYSYIKIDFNGVGNSFNDPAKTSLQALRDLYGLYRQAAGDEAFILSCVGQPKRAVIGYADALRVGPDAHPAHLEKCLESVLRFQIYENVWWQNDPDVSYLAPRLPSRKVGYTPQGEGMWKTWHNVVGLVGGTAMISEPLAKPDVQAVWRNFEIMRPSSAEPASLLTLGKSPANTVFGFSAKRPYGDFAVYNLYNCTEGTKPVALDFKDAGIAAGVKCAVFDFWANKVVGYARDAYATPPLEYRSSALLRFTEIVTGRPVLVGSNLHLSMGATEIGHLRTTPSKVEIKLTDAGAHEGCLTFYSEKPLLDGGAENCKVAGVENLGENLWKVTLADRLWGKPQSVTLNIAN